MSPTSDLSSLFAYSPPKAWSESREKIGAAPRPRTAPHLSPTSILKRPSYAGNVAAPNRPAPKRNRHRLSNSAGNLYVPEIPSPLRRQRSMGTEALEERSDNHRKGPSSLTRSSSNAITNINKMELSSSSSCTGVVPSTAISARTLTSIRQESQYISPPLAAKLTRPASVGTGIQKLSSSFVTRTPTLSKHPSSGGSTVSKKTASLPPSAPISHSRRTSSSGSVASKKSTSSSLWFFSRSRPATPEMYEASINTATVKAKRKVTTILQSRAQTVKRPSTAPRLRSLARPSTAPQPAQKTAPLEIQQRPGSSRLFKKVRTLFIIHMRKWLIRLVVEV